MVATARLERINNCDDSAAGIAFEAVGDGVIGVPFTCSPLEPVTFPSNIEAIEQIFLSP